MQIRSQDILAKEMGKKMILTHTSNRNPNFLLSHILGFERYSVICETVYFFVPEVMHERNLLRGMCPERMDEV